MTRFDLILSCILKVDTYENIYNDISRLDDAFIIDKWFRVDNKPFKTILLNTVKKWSYMFKHHLMDDIINSLNDLEAFMREKDKYLIRNVPEGDYKALTDMMGHLGAVRERAVHYDDMFDPIKEKIELLKTYGQEVSDEIYDKLEV
jgi:dynein heavy chain